MKNIFTLFVSFLLTISCCFSQLDKIQDDFRKCTDTYNAEIQKYNQKIISFNIWVTTSKESATARIATGKSKIAAINQLLTNSIKTFKTLPTVDGTYTLRDTLISGFQNIIQLNSGKDMLVVVNYNDEKTVEDMKAFYASFFKIKKRSKLIQSKIESYTDKLYLKYQLSPVRGAAHERIDRINKATRYINSMKGSSNILTKYFNDIMDGLNTDNDSIVKRRAIDMKKYSQWVLPKLKGLGGYQGNADILNNTITKAEYLSTEGYQHVVNMVKNMKHTKVTTLAGMSDEEVAAYNKGFDSYQTSSQALQKRVMQLINEYNQYLAAFSNKHFR